MIAEAELLAARAAQAMNDAPLALEHLDAAAHWLQGLHGRSAQTLYARVFQQRAAVQRKPAMPKPHETTLSRRRPSPASGWRQNTRWYWRSPWNAVHDRLEAGEADGITRLTALRS